MTVRWGARHKDNKEEREREIDACWKPSTSDRLQAHRWCVSSESVEAPSEPPSKQMKHWPTAQKTFISQSPRPTLVKWRLPEMTPDPLLLFRENTTNPPSQGPLRFHHACLLQNVYQTEDHGSAFLLHVMTQILDAEAVLS